jgi:hypothetical protein
MRNNNTNTADGTCLLVDGFGVTVVNACGDDDYPVAIHVRPGTSAKVFAAALDQAKTAALANWRKLARHTRGDLAIEMPA